MITIENIAKQMRKGVLDVIILSMLKDKPKYPREVIELLSGYGLSIVEGTIYPLFLRLYKSKLVQYEWREASGHPRKYYSLTEQGSAALAQYRDEWRLLNAVLTRVNDGEI